MNVKQIYLLPISQKGQVTIPVEIRRLLNLNKYRKVIFEIFSKKKVLVKPPTMTLDQVFGAVKPIKKDFDQIRKTAREERIENKVR